MRPPSAFHGHPGLITLWVGVYLFCYVPEIVFSRRLRSGAGAHKADRGSMLVVIVAANLAVVAGFLAAVLLPRLAFRLHWKAIFAAGLVVWVGGTLFRWYSIWTLGRLFTFDVAISDGQRVIDRGPYRWIRHPSYLGALLGELGFGLTLTNPAAMLLPPVCLGLAYVYRIRVEERALLDGLGPAYCEYMQRSWRLIPFVF
jgi:protein-S-isoprenylcysteine O-methyltransferase Ste14